METITQTQWDKTFIDYKSVINGQKHILKHIDGKGSCLVPVNIAPEIKPYTIHISTPDTAKMIRKALKKQFPTIKFSVRSKSYSGGSSITVYWTNGPTAYKVDKVLKRFEGATFDGMRDLKEYVSFVVEGQRYSFGSDYVFTNRTVTDDVYIDTANKLIGYYEALSKFAEVKTVDDIFDNSTWIPELQCYFNTLVGREVGKVDIY